MLRRVLRRRIARHRVHPVRVHVRVVVQPDARVQRGLAVAGDVPRQAGAARARCPGCRGSQQYATVSGGNQPPPQDREETIGQALDVYRDFGINELYVKPQKIVTAPVAVTTQPALESLRTVDLGVCTRGTRKPRAHSEDPLCEAIRARLHCRRLLRPGLLQFSVLDVKFVDAEIAIHVQRLPDQFFTTEEPLRASVVRSIRSSQCRCNRRLFLKRQMFHVTGLVQDQHFIGIRSELSFSPTRLATMN